MDTSEVMRCSRTRSCKARQIAASDATPAQPSWRSRWTGRGRGSLSPPRFSCNTATVVTGSERPPQNLARPIVARRSHASIGVPSTSLPPVSTPNRVKSSPASPREGTRSEPGRCTQQHRGEKGSRSDETNERDEGRRAAGWPWGVPSPLKSPATVQHPIRRPRQAYPRHPHRAARPSRLPIARRQLHLRLDDNYTCASQRARRRSGSG
jgi:hypothetical protein